MTVTRRPEPPERELTAQEVACLIGTAGRAPSVHNTQPWQFRPDRAVIELRADPRRMLTHADPDGREMLISCGAALYGLRLGMRKLGYLPAVDVLPDPTQPELVARVWAVGGAPPTRDEWDLIAAVPHRHTHRGPFVPGRVPVRVLAALADDAAAEGTQLIAVHHPDQVRQLIDLTAAAARVERSDPARRAEARRWARTAGSAARDGVPAHARVSAERPADDRAWPSRAVRLDAEGQLAGEEPAQERLPQRDYGWPGLRASDGSLPSATAVLVTADDSPPRWVQAGQALNHLLLHAATRWVFASLQSQALESPELREEIARRLGLPGRPQLLLQFGRANTAAATARRPAAEVRQDPAAGDQED